MQEGIYSASLVMIRQSLFLFFFQVDTAGMTNDFQTGDEVVKRKGYVAERISEIPLGVCGF